MKIRQARKILNGKTPKRMLKRLGVLYPPYIENGRTVYPGWSDYHRIAKAWVVVHRKIHKYGDKFKQM